MEFYEVLSRRRMNRAFTPDPVPDESLDRILRSVRRAPSAGYSQGQSLVVVRDPGTRGQIAERFGEPEYVAGGWKPFVSTAPVHVVICATEQLYHDRYTEPDKLDANGAEIGWPVPYWYVDAGAAMMLILLTAIEEGLAAGFIGHPDQESILRELLGLPEGTIPIGVALIGHPASDPREAPVTQRLVDRRAPLERVVQWEHWTDA